MDNAIWKSKIKNRADLVLKLARYNLKIIFAGRFFWFVAASLVFYILLSVQLVFNTPAFNSSNIYGILIFPGILLVFYPTVFGIQNDADSRILEILFGIPDYRYKVWLLRLFMIFLLTWAILYLFCWIGYFGLIPFPVFNMSFQLMFPVLFLGSLAFLVSTIVKNGNGTAVVMILLGVAMMMLTEVLDRTQWNVFHNPYNIPNRMNEMVWAQVSQKNRIFLSISSLVFLLGGLTNLQRREKFLK
ncbi:MAG TPA: hypothetical protein VN249_00370 [Prolixibacteraceae bacterium]|nr:hypothetical protein [Prolixibacteraceae bacterium]